MTAANPQAKYNQATKQPVNKVIAALIFCLVFAVGVVVWRIYTNNTSGTVEGSMVSFSRSSDDSPVLDVTFDVSRSNPEQDAYCIIQALDFAKNEIGRRDVFLPAASEQNQRVKVQVTTSGIPVAAKIYGCGDSVPAYLTGAKN